MKKFTYLLTLGAFLTIASVNVYAYDGGKACKTKAAKTTAEAKKECSGTKCDAKKSGMKADLKEEKMSCCAKKGVKAMNETPAKETDKKS